MPDQQPQAPQQAAPQAPPPAIEPGGKHPMRHMAMIGISVLVTATIVGGGVYVWLNMQSQQDAADSRDQIAMLEGEKTDLEEQVMELKDEAAMMEEEKMEDAMVELPDISLEDDQETQMIRVLNHGKEVGVIDVSEQYDPGFYGAAIFEQFDDKVFVQVNPDGLGGYILYSGAFDLYEVDLKTGAIEEIDYGSGFATDVSPDGAVVAGVMKVEEENKIFALEIATGETVTFDADPSYGQFGSVMFSPNGKLIAYAGSVAQPQVDESGGVHIINLTTGVSELYTETPQPAAVTGWGNNEYPSYTY